MTEVTLTWPRRSTFVDHQRDESFEGPGATVQVDNNSDRYDHYVDRGWVEGTPDEVLDDDEQEAAGIDTSGPSVDTDVFVNAFVEQSATDQADAIEAGDVDDFLDEIEQANADGEEYATVQDAIDNRRDELQG